MQLPDRDGIYCDFCGTSYRKQFTYYSTEAKIIKLVNSITVGQNSANLNKDMCESCYGKLMNTVKENLGNTKKNFVKCDLSKSYKNGTFEYHIIYFHKVKVDQDLDPNTTVDRMFMDLNVINGFDKLLDQTKVINDRIRDQGWS